jgi:ABC-type antimicrobial peptide transport system permease subunit
MPAVIAAMGLEGGEARFVVVGGLVFGAPAGWGVAFAVVTILTGVFHAPRHLDWPWPSLALVLVAVVAAAVAAGMGATRAARRSVSSTIREL